MGSLEKIVGQKYGRLTVIKRSDKRRNKSGTLWQVKCDCGNILEATAGHLKYGHTKSCGCYNIEQIKQRMKGNKNFQLPPGQSALNGLIHRYKANARIRGINWFLTKQECIDLFQANCHYCGIEPKQLYQTIGHSNNITSIYRHNGIDRINSNNDYKISNVVTSCKWCNYAKRDRTQQEFYDWARRLNERISR